ncbi:MAG: hypothetical protein ACE5KT_00345 [Methanosarcinales archaeon]
MKIFKNGKELEEELKKNPKKYINKEFLINDKNGNTVIRGTIREIRETGIVIDVITLQTQEMNN